MLTASRRLIWHGMVARGRTARENALLAQSKARTPRLVAGACDNVTSTEKGLFRPLVRLPNPAHLYLVPDTHMGSSAPNNFGTILVPFLQPWGVQD